jgi:long-chain acyl-CoA synthetase
MLREDANEGLKLVGIFSKNRYEWLVSDIACCIFGVTIVPLYETLGMENLSYCLNHSEITTCFVSGETAKTLLKLKNHGKLTDLIIFDEITK